jgi:hypothetical protein
MELKDKFHVLTVFAPKNESPASAESESGWTPEPVKMHWIRENILLTSRIEQRFLCRQSCKVASVMNTPYSKYKRNVAKRRGFVFMNLRKWNKPSALSTFTIQL